MSENVAYIFRTRLNDVMASKGIEPEDFDLFDDVVSSQSVRSYLSGKALPNLKSLVTLAAFLDVSIDWLCGMEDFEFDAYPRETTPDIFRKAPWLE